MSDVLLIQDVTARSRNGIVMRWVLTDTDKAAHLLPENEPATGHTFCGRKSEWKRPILDDTPVCPSCADLGADFIRILTPNG